jgi:hypothetical protein
VRVRPVKSVLATYFFRFHVFVATKEIKLAILMSTPAKKFMKTGSR